MLQDGRHPARAVHLQFGEASTGTIQVAVTFEITDGPGLGEFVTWLGSLTDKAAKQTLKALAVCGAPRGKGLDELTSADLSSLVSLVLEWESHEGKKRLRVKWVNRPGGGFTMKHPIVGADLRKLGAEWKADFDQTERYEPIEVPEPTAKPEPNEDAGDGSDLAPPGGREPIGDHTQGQAHPFAPDNDEDIPF